MKIRVLMIILVSMSLQPIFAQQNTVSFKEGGSSPKASLQDVSWISGHWKGKAFGGTTEKYWSPPLGNSMMGVFKLVVNDKVNMYHVTTIAEENNSLILRLKHFNFDLKGWEEKDKTLDFRLVKIESDRIYFDDYTVERISDDHVRIYIILGTEEGTNQEIEFDYYRVE